MRSKELHEGDMFLYDGWGFELLYWDPMYPDDYEYGVASTEFKEDYAPDLELIIGFVPQGATKKDVERIIAENFWKVQERIDYIDAAEKVTPDTGQYDWYQCEWCESTLADSEILYGYDENGYRAWECPRCGRTGRFTLVESTKGNLNRKNKTRRGRR